VQLYEAAANLVLFFALSLLGRRKRWDGQVLCAYLVSYAVVRFVLELWRGDAARKMVVGPISTSQGIALLTLPLAALLWQLRRRSAFSRA
jgi:phosphatidylglycerol:prolipoprotein diacylglycerol transferase